jgi:hypothetical protein
MQACPLSSDGVASLAILPQIEALCTWLQQVTNWIKETYTLSLKGLPLPAHSMSQKEEVVQEDGNWGQRRAYGSAQ